MSKKNKVGKTLIDFDVGIGKIVPATQEAFSEEGFSAPIRKDEKASLTSFKQVFSGKIEINLKGDDRFPTANEVFVFIVQYFASQKEYSHRDIDNMAKTILDVLQSRLYHDDSQVKTLLVSKKMEKRVPQSFAYTAVKVLNRDQDVEAVKNSGMERSVTMFQELKSKGIL